MVSSSIRQKNPRIVESTVGTLVWVQRRNGSWWPGQILRLEEVVESRVASPESGTPIKLLCRDDVSLEWYNLEMSKQVKAFRCGEYDVCIRKAKAAAESASKKSVRLTKREKAILLALELECALVSKAQENNQSTPDNYESDPCESSPEVSPSTSEHPNDSDSLSEETSAFDENSNSAHEMSHSGISYEETNGSSHVKDQSTIGRKRAKHESEDEGSNKIMHMRGLKDLGQVGIGCKVEPGMLTNAISQGKVSVNDFHFVSIGSTANGAQGAIPSLRRKRTENPHAHEVSKRKDCRRTLTKALDMLVAVPVIFDEFGEVLGLEPNEAKGTLPLDADTLDSSAPSVNVNALMQIKLEDSKDPCDAMFVDDWIAGNLFDVPIFIEDLHAGSAPSPLKRQNDAYGHTTQNCKGESVRWNNDPSELSSATPPSAHIDPVAQNLDTNTSNWQIKGRRKSRHSSKIECLDEDPDELNALTDSAHLIGPFCPSRARMSSHSMDGSAHWNIYMEMMYDVNIEVKSSYRPHVPYISLMSKLNGKPITGHPVTVEVMDEDNWQEPLLDSSDYCPTSSGREVGDDEEADMDFVIKPKSSSLLKPCKSKSSKSKKHRQSSKKTCRLSALTRSRRWNHGSKCMDQDLKGPTLACIPLKIVFSRINEALSTSSHHRCPL
ncbi:hypothetical protein AKJ16_DCAP04198 [Drosera capensis]